MKKYKKIIVALTILIVLYNISWFSVYFFKYHSYTKNFPITENGKYLLEKDGYYFSVKKPDYLSYTGNLAITNKTNDLSIIIWPLLTKGYEYGLQMTSDDQTIYHIIVDSDLKYVDDKNSKFIDKTVANKIIKDNKTEIEAMVSKAHNIWNIK
ncbi:hypothetical protein H1Z61_17380 [Bacillus aquiflavi]|uniref:DUF4825 domain-containing protein n=1 Tax=Bacillus aquiflavi TaxID=2672567 RepID=A0A6B3W5H5_9BACI|nr:hypothetical protein [Bacillus aquiflavi]MBA4538844.1 hypothetical protein [Bacillus aquiflavi]NEY83203.1 hypothetical protein [Bacillus aquiflavi]